MINGLHALIYAKNAAKARAFLKDVLGFPSVDAGKGWLIFAMPPAELAAHPADDPDDSGTHELYFMCDDIKKTVAQLKGKGVKFTRPITDQGYGLVTRMKIPGGGKIGLYEPRHPRPARSARRVRASSARTSSGQGKRSSAPRRP